LARDRFNGTVIPSLILFGFRFDGFLDLPLIGDAKDYPVKPGHWLLSGVHLALFPNVQQYWLDVSTAKLGPLDNSFKRRLLCKGNTRSK